MKLYNFVCEAERSLVEIVLRILVYIVRSSTEKNIQKILHEECYPSLGGYHHKQFRSEESVRKLKK